MIESSMMRADQPHEVEISPKGRLTVRIDVQADRAIYPVLIGPGLLADLRALLTAHGITGPPIVVTCGPVWRRQSRRLRSLTRGRPAVLIPDGERAKTLATTARLYEAFVRKGLDRSSTVIAFGGGVVGDVAGFAAATFQRGLRVVQIPTTLLAQVDSAIGGKTGVNLAAGKNLVGAFHSPALVLCDPQVLASLPAHEFQAGLFEVIKYGIIASRPLFDRVTSRLDALLRQDPDELTFVIAACCRIKAEVVTKDERETGLRRVLNFGHTVGHALEAITHYRRFRHGEAVGHGIRAATYLSLTRGFISRDDAARVFEAIDRLGPLPRVTDLRVPAALDAIGRDKKRVAGRLHFVLARGIGATEIVPDVTPAELRSALKFLGLRA
jgi:3-dehydroquinate synthase